MKYRTLPVYLPESVDANVQDCFSVPITIVRLPSADALVGNVLVSTFRNVKTV